MRNATTVLSLGSGNWSNTLRKELLQGQKEGFIGVESYWKLCALPEYVSVDVAVLHHSFGKDDLRYAAEYIRRRWPLARILLIGWRADSLDDPLYDDGKSGGMPPEELVHWIAESITTKWQTGRNGKTGPGNACA